MAHKIISQKKFLKGVNAGTGILTEPPGTVTRISNLLFTQRGSLQTIPGSSVIANLGKWSFFSSIFLDSIAMGYFNSMAASQFPYYISLSTTSIPVIAPVANVTAAPVAGSGNAAGTYIFGVTASASLIPGGNTSITQVTMTASATFSGVTFNWTSVLGDVYTVWYVLPDGVSVQLATGVSPGYVFSGTLPTSPLSPTPYASTMFPLIVQLLSVQYGEGVIAHVVEATSGSNVFPLTQRGIPAPLPLGDPEFTSTPLVPGFSPYGGLTGVAAPVPQIIAFDSQVILILGNALPPEVFIPPNGTMAPLTNTFTATYPSWQATVAWTEGSQIAVVVGGTNYLFTATQGGVSGGSSPTFPATLGATVSDGQVIWTNGGKITTSVAPRGAAHGIIYAGSLWIANTSPQTTSDNLDGPTCLKMSDSNNPNSWNPVNTAFIGKDDGTQITGFATYTIAEVGIAPTGSLVVFKEFSTYQILGVFGATDFQITQAETDMGCIAARSVLFIPGYGIMRLTHLGFGIFNGVRDRLVSEEIRPYIFGGTGLDSDITGIDFTTIYLAQAAQVANPPMYVCACPLTSSSGSLTRVFAYDLVLKAWTIFDLPWSIGALMQARVGEGLPLLVAGLTDGSGNIERLFAGDVNWDSQTGGSNTPITWTFRTSHVYQEGSALRGFFRRVTIRGYAAQSAAGNVQVSLLINGNPSISYATYLQPQPNSGQFQLTVDIMATANIVAVQVTGTGPATIDGLDWQVDPKPSMALVVG